MNKKVANDRPEFQAAKDETAARIATMLGANGTRSVDSFHRELGGIMWEYCGMARTAEGLKKAISLIGDLKKQYWRDVKVLGSNESPNQSLEKAGRVADFFELAELMCIDALHRNESCGGHFRVEYQAGGEAARNDEEFAYVAAWEYQGENARPALLKEPLVFDNVHLATRSYK
jgi:succinate dehydrogenase / fumarate reductase flavoprotein subunit